MSIFPEKVSKISFLIHRSDIEDVIDDLVERGLIQISEVHLEENLQKDAETESLLSEIIPYENRLKKVISILRPYHRVVRLSLIHI